MILRSETFDDKNDSFPTQPGSFFVWLYFLICLFQIGSQYWVSWLAWNSYHKVQAALQLTDICLPLLPSASVKGMDHHAWWLVLIEGKIKVSPQVRGTVPQPKDELYSQ